jgi:hypothetical protein
MITTTKNGDLRERSKQDTASSRPGLRFYSRTKNSGGLLQLSACGVLSPPGLGRQPGEYFVWLWDVFFAWFQAAASFSHQRRSPVHCACNSQSMKTPNYLLYSMSTHPVNDCQFSTQSERIPCQPTNHTPKKKDVRRRRKTSIDAGWQRATSPRQ